MYFCYCTYIIGYKPYISQFSTDMLVFAMSTTEYFWDFSVWKTMITEYDFGVLLLDISVMNISMSSIYRYISIYLSISTVCLQLCYKLILPALSLNSHLNKPSLQRHRNEPCVGHGVFVRLSPHKNLTVICTLHQMKMIYKHIWNITENLKNYKIKRSLSQRRYFNLINCIYLYNIMINYLIMC